MLAGLPQVSRLGSAAGDFLPFQNGADFASDLSNNRCAAAGVNAVFTPVYARPNRSLSDAAYCLYRLELDPAATSATLSLIWNGVTPEPNLCWVGLANWSSGRWDWQPLTTNEIELANPAEYGDAQQHCYVAFAVLGETQVELISVSFGPLPPPPSNGYTLFQPMVGVTARLIDDKGTVVHSWVGEYTPGASVILAADGYLWRQVRITNADFAVGGQGGRLEKVDWDGNVVWSYELSTTTQCSHHDFSLMPNGNILFLVWNSWTMQQTIDAGRDPATVSPYGLFLDSVFEIAPEETGGTIVWQWFASDHLVQNFDSSKPNYGDPAAHPELLDFNYFAINNDDWLHLNSVDYNAELDQIVVDSYSLSELYVIDHSTTTAEAAGHSGGRYHHGGDLLYRWGNPQAYGAGLAPERKLFEPHDVHWIQAGYSGAGDLLLFNNNAGTPDNNKKYSSIVQITPPLNPDGSYYRTGPAYGPEELSWLYLGNPPEKFYGLNMSSAQRLLDGNTLICNGPQGKFFEVTPGGQTVWEYENPYPTPGAMVFRATRYPWDYPGLASLQP